MKDVLLLFSLIFGLCSSLQPGLEYQYRYSGRVATGITDVRHQFSAAGIQADVTVQVSEDLTRIVQFSNVEVGDFHDDFTCDIRTPLPIEYHSIEEGKELLEKPFKVVVNTSMVGDVLEVPIEPAWITNIRKSVISIFRILPFDEGGENTLLHLNFMIRESMLTGKCANWYNVVKLPEDEAAKENHEREHIMEVDVQREASTSGSLTSKGRKGHHKGAKGAKGRKGSKGRKGHKTSTPSRYSTSSVPSIDDTLWTLVKDTDFEDCEYSFSMKGHMNHHTEELIGRSSVGYYLIRGGNDAMRIERAVLEGSITLFTHDDHREHLDTLTNQTLELKAVRAIQHQLTIDYDTHQMKTWYYEVDHVTIDERVEGVQPSIEQILTGIEVTEETITIVKRIIDAGIQDLSDRMPRNPTHTDNIVSEMNHVVEALSLLSHQQIEEIYNDYMTEYNEATSLDAQLEAEEYQLRRIYILKQALIAAGTEPAIFFLLDKMTDETFRLQDYDTLYNLFSQIKNTIKSPLYIQKMMEVVMALHWDDHGRNDKSLALITFSQLLNEMCFSSERRTCHRGATNCNHDYVCQPESILNSYVKYLEQGLEDEESPIWQRLIYLQALSTLGTPHTISILKPYILGSKESNFVFRKNAIWSLSKLNMPKTATGMVFQMLMPVFENVAEHHEIRSIAFLVMATWGDSVSWWHHMAVSTWHDPSNKVSNFVSTTIKTTAHMQGGGTMAKVVSRVEHLIKPSAPASITHSTNYYLMEYLSYYEFGSPLTFAWLVNSRSLMPSEVYFRLKVTTFFGFTHDIKGSIQQLGVDGRLIKWLSSLMMDQNTQVDQDAVSIVYEMFNELKEHLGLDPTTETPDDVVLLKIKQVFKFFRTITKDEAHPDSVIERFWNRLPRIINIPHYNRYLDAFVVIPTNLGLPFIVKHTAQHAWWLFIDYTRSQSSLQSKGAMSITLDASKMLTLEAKTLVPWSNKFAIGTGTDKLMSLLLPFNINYQTNFKNYEIQLTFEPITNDKVKLIEAHNLPFTVQYGAFPTLVHYHDNDCKTIKKYDVCLYIRKSQVLPSSLGLWIESEWTGDIPFTINFRSLYKGELALLKPSLETWDYHVLYDPEASTTKSITTSYTYVSTDKTSGFVEVSGELETLGQESQSSVDYSDYSQFSQSSSADYQEFGEVDAAFQEQSATRQRIAKLQEQVVPATGGHVRSISIDFHLQGTPNRKYETVLTWATGITSSKSSTKFQISFVKAVPEGVLDQPHATCLNVQILKPLIRPLTSVDETLAKDFHAIIEANVHDGINCDQPPILEIEGSMDISQEQFEETRKKMTEENCDSLSEYLPIDMITSPIYDHIHFKAHWAEVFPVNLKNLTYWAGDVFRGHVFPDIFFDYTANNPDNKMEIDATKCMKRHKWNIHTTKPIGVSITEGFESFYLLDIIASPANVKDTLIYDFLNGRQHQVCVIDYHKIRTSDGLEIPYEPSECWNSIAMDITGNDARSIDVRFVDGEWEARIMFPNEGLFLEMTKTALKVNGEDFRGEDPRFNIDYLQDGAMLTMPFITNSILKITDKVYFLEEQFYRSMFNGICGNFDGEKSGEMVGPTGCIYTDPELFIKSWTSPGPGCGGFTFQGIRRPVEAYQDVCPRKTYIPTGVSYPDTLVNCVEWEYLEKTEGSFKCKALTPTPKCKEGCTAIYSIATQIEFDCGLTDPEHFIQACFPKTFTTTYPVTCKKTTSIAH